MTVIAMTQEMGTLGKDVALGVADALGLAQVRDEISEHVARHVDKHDSAIGRYLDGKAGLRERVGINRRSLAIYSAEEVYEHAVKDDVLIRGWGAVYLLQPVAHVLRVRICAPFEQRVRWLMERLDADKAFAEEEVRRSDAARAANIRRWFDKSFGDPLDYDLVLNTGRVSVAGAIETIQSMVRRPEFQPTAASRAKLAGLALQAKVRTALAAHPATAQLRVTIEVDGGKVTLSGIVVEAGERDACERVVATTPGVTDVVNELKVMKGHKLFRQ